VAKTLTVDKYVAKNAATFHMRGTLAFMLKNGKHASLLIMATNMNEFMQAILPGNYINILVGKQ